MYIIRIRWADGDTGRMVKTFDDREEAERGAAKLNEQNKITSIGPIHHWVEEADDDEPKKTLKERELEYERQREIEWERLFPRRKHICASCHDTKVCSKCKGFFANDARGCDMCGYTGKCRFCSNKGG